MPDIRKHILRSVASVFPQSPIPACPFSPFSKNLSPKARTNLWWCEWYCGMVRWLSMSCVQGVLWEVGVRLSREGPGDGGCRWVSEVRCSWKNEDGRLVISRMLSANIPWHQAVDLSLFLFYCIVGHSHFLIDNKLLLTWLKDSTYNAGSRSSCAIGYLGPGRQRTRPPATIPDHISKRRSTIRSRRLQACHNSCWGSNTTWVRAY